MQKALRHVERDSKTGLQNLQACTNTVLTEYNKKYTNRMSKLEEEVASTKTQVTVNNTSVNQTLSALGQAVDTQKEIHTEIKTLIVSRDTTVG